MLTSADCERSAFRIAEVFRHVARRIKGIQIRNAVRSKFQNYQFFGTAKLREHFSFIFHLKGEY